MKKILRTYSSTTTNILNNFSSLQNRILIIVGVLVLFLVLVLILFTPQKTELSYQIEQPQYYHQALVIKTFKNTFRVQPVNAQESSEKVVEGKDKVKYVDAYLNTDIVQTLSKDKIKEDVILKKPGHPKKFSYKLDLENYDFEKTNQGDFIFYIKGHLGEELYKSFTIPAPYLIDAQGKQSHPKFVQTEIKEGILTLIPSSEWLETHEYPIILDPTIEITILNLHSHPQQGEDWIVEFTTHGQADLYIFPDDQATINDDEFTGLYCGDQERFPEILADDVIYYPDWECNEIAKVVHYTLVAGNHTLRFEFGNQINYAYNSTPNFDGNHKWAWGENIGWNNFESTNGGVEVADAGLTGYIWAENVGWIKLDYDGTAGATNTNSTNWGVTNDGSGNLSGYAWGENIGWVNFNPSNSQVTIDSNGDFSGYAWAENIGWIKFDHNQTSYTPKTTWSPTSIQAHPVIFKKNIIFKKNVIFK